MIVPYDILSNISRNIYYLLILGGILMQIGEKLKNLGIKQKEFLNEYEQVVKDFEANDLVNQNEELKKELDLHKKLVSEIKEKYNKVTEENQNLKVSLQEQVLDEKLNILKISKDKLDIYFKSESEVYTNELLRLEISAKDKMNKLKDTAERQLGQDSIEFVNKVDELSKELNEKINQRREDFLGEKQSIENDINNRTQYLAEEGISEKVLQKRIKNNNIEIKIGLSWINKIGILLILIGTATFLQYSYVNWFGPYMRGMFAFLLGGLFLVIGEVFNKKERDVFAKGLTGGGIAILYYAII